MDARILLEHRADPGEKKEEKGAKPTFRTPNFRGSPCEVLGIEPNSTPEQINAAYKYWIKRYHPDRVSHLGEAYVEQARRRAEQLNTARQALLGVKKI